MRSQAPKSAQKKSGPDLRKVPPPAKTIQKKQPNQSIVAKPKAKVRKLIAQSGVKKKAAKLEDKAEKNVTKKIIKTEKASQSAAGSAKLQTKASRVRSKSPNKKVEVTSTSTQATTIIETTATSPKNSTPALKTVSSTNKPLFTKATPSAPKILPSAPKAPTTAPKTNIVNKQTTLSKLTVAGCKTASSEPTLSSTELLPSIGETKPTESAGKKTSMNPLTSSQKSSKCEAQPLNIMPKFVTTVPKPQLTTLELATNICKPPVKKPVIAKKDKPVPKSTKSQNKTKKSCTAQNSTDHHEKEDKVQCKNMKKDGKNVDSKIKPIPRKRAARVPSKKPSKEIKQKQNQLYVEKESSDDLISSSTHTAQTKVNKNLESGIEALVCSSKIEREKSQTLAAVSSGQEIDSKFIIIPAENKSDAVELKPKADVKDLIKSKTEVCERVPKFFTSSRHSKSIDGDSKNVKCNFISSMDKTSFGKKDDVSEQHKYNRTSSILADTESEIDVYTFTDFKADSPNSILKDYRNPLGRKVGKVRPIARVKGTVIDHFRDEEKNKQDSIKTSKTSKKSVDAQREDESQRTMDGFNDSKTAMAPVTSETASPVKNKKKTTGQNKTKNLRLKILKPSQIDKRQLLKRSRIRMKPKFVFKRTSGSSQTEDDDDEFDNSTFALNVNVLGKGEKEGSESIAANKKTKSPVLKLSSSSSSSDDGSSDFTSGDSSDNRKLKPPTAAKISRRSSDNPFENPDDSRRRSKLLGFWNGPKKHRMASLNALAKVHCLYENESRTHMELGLMKTIDRTIRLKNVATKKTSLASVTPVKTSENRGSTSDSEYEKKNIIKTNDSSEDDVPEPSTRNLRVVPGSRGAGKYWDPKSSTSSSEEADSDAEVSKKVPEKKKAVAKSPAKSGDVKTLVKAKKISGVMVKKRRKRNEVVMDLRDMVVQKRMASLNATAILAASYEKRSSKSSKEETTSDSCSDKDETYAKKRLIRDNTSRCEEPGASGTTAPKVEVIVNRESDVTITGVYAHHEGYCMSKMQYHYSSTSHTKTTATTSTEESAHDECPRPRGPYTPLNALSSMRPPANPPDDLDGHNPPALSISCEGSPEHERIAARAPGPPPPCALRAGPCSLGVLGRRGGASAFSAPPPSPAHHRDAGAGPSSGGGGSSQGYYQPAGPLIKEAPRDSEGERRARDLARYHPPHAHYHTHHPPHHQQMIHHYGAPPYAYGGDLCYSRFYRPQPAPNAYLPPGAPPDSQLVGMGGGDSYPAPPQFYGAPPCYQHGPRGLPYIDYSPCTCPMNTCSKNVLIGPAIGNPPTGGGPATNGNNGGAFGGDDDPLAATVAVERPGAVPEPPGAPGPPSPARGSAGACTPQPPSAGPRRARLGKAAVRRSLAATDSAALVRPAAPVVLPPAPPDIKIERPDSAHDDLDVSHVENVAPTQPVLPPAPPVQVAVTPLTPPPCLALQTLAHVASPEPEPTLVSTPVDLAPTKLIALETGVKRRREASKPEVAEIAEHAAPVNGIGEHVKLQKRRKVESRQLTGTYKDLISPEAVKVVRLNNGKKQLNVPKDTKPIAKAVLKPPSEVVTARASSASKPNKRKAVPNLIDEPPKKKSIESEAVDLSVFRPKNKSALLLDKLLEKNAADREIERVIESVVRNYSPPSPPPADRTINNNVLEKAPSSVKKVVPTKTLRKESTEVKQIEVKQSASERVEPSASTSAVRSAARRASKGRGKAGPRRRRGSGATAATLEEAYETTAVTPRWSNGWTWEGEPIVNKVFLNNDESVSVMRRCWAGMVHSRAGDRVSRGDCVLLRASARRGNDEQPFVARVARLWENPSDGEMMVSLVWYYRPEHTERGPAPGDAPDEVFASRHRDANSVACIEDKCYVLTFNEYCRYRARLRAAQEGITRGPSIVPELSPGDVPPAAATNDSRLPLNIAPELVLFCRKVYDYRSKKIQIPTK